MGEGIAADDPEELDNFPGLSSLLRLVMRVMSFNLSMDLPSAATKLASYLRCKWDRTGEFQIVITAMDIRRIPAHRKINVLVVYAILSRYDWWKPIRIVVSLHQTI